MATLSIRGVDEETARLLKEAAQKAGSSVNAQVLEFVRQGLGLEEARGRRGRHRDLDHLAGTWSEADVRDFEAATAAFEEVDEELWR
jgi:plasmid stability protein